MQHFNFFKKRVSSWATLCMMLMFLSSSLHAQQTHYISSGSFTIPGNSTQDYVITGSTTNNNYGVVIEEGYQGTVTLDNLTITHNGGTMPTILVKGRFNQSNLSPVTNVNIVLVGQNRLTFLGNTAATFQVEQGAQINIQTVDGTNTSGSLYARTTNSAPGTAGSGGGGAAIGAPNNTSNQYYAEGYAVVTDPLGNVITAGNTYSAQNGGHRTAGGNIIISSGTIEAYGAHGAGIGGGYYTWYDGIIIVTGGKVTAYAGRHAAGLGSGCPLGSGLEKNFTQNSAIIALPPCEIEAYGCLTTAASVSADIGLAGTKYLTYVNDPKKPVVTIYPEDYEKNANIYLDLSETPGMKPIFDAVHRDFDVYKVWIGRTAQSDGKINVHGLFQNRTTFFTDASSSAAATLGRPYLPVSQTTPNYNNSIMLPLFQANISFTDFASKSLVEGYSATEARTNAFVIKIEYNDNMAFSKLTFELQAAKDGGTSDFTNLIFLDKDSVVTSAPETLRQGDVYYIVTPLAQNKQIGGYSDVVLIRGEYENKMLDGYLRRISAQVVVRDDTGVNNHIKVTADPMSFTELYPANKTVALTLNIDHKGFAPNYDASKVIAKYIITTEQNYVDAVAATPVDQWTNLTAPTSESTGGVTTAQFAGLSSGTYYIHWYVESGYIMAHSQDVIDPARQYGGFGKYAIIDGKEVTYYGNTNNGGSVPVDATKYAVGSTVNVRGNTGILTKTNATFIGWSFGASSLVTTAAGVPADLSNVGDNFTITTDTALYAVWAIDENGPENKGDSIPDYLQFAVLYNGNGNTTGTAPVDVNLYSTGHMVTAKDKGNLARTGTDKIVFAGWSTTVIPAVLTFSSAGDTTAVGGTFIRANNKFPITGNMTLYAVWSTDINDNDEPDIFENAYRVTYDGNGNTGGTVPTDATSYLGGMNVTAKGKGDLARTNAVFLGWTRQAVSLITTEAAETNAAIILPDSVFKISGSLTLYAAWAADNNGPDGDPDDVPDYKQFSVTYYGNGNSSGTAPTDPNIYNVGNNVIAKSAGSLRKTNYTFIGWNPTETSVVTTQAEEDALISMIQPGATFVVTGAMNWYAVWAIDETGPIGGSDSIPDYRQASVTYYGNNNTGGSVPSDGNAYNLGDNATAKPAGNMIKSGFAFIGWNPTATNDIMTQAQEDALTSMIQPGDEFVVRGKMDWYAVWAIDTNGDSIPDYKQFAVTYNGNGNTGGTAPVDNNRYNSGNTVTAAAGSGLTRTGTDKIVLAGWTPSPITRVLTSATKADTTTAFIRLSGTFIIDSNVTLYAVWSTDINDNNTPDIFEDGFKVTYDGNGATFGTAPVDGGSYLPGMQATAKAKGNLARTNATFLGWSTSAVALVTSSGEETAANVIAVDASITFATSDINLYAVWAKDESGPEGKSDDVPDYLQFSVTYHGNNNTGGTAPTDNNLYNANNVVTLKAKGNLARTSSTFIGWSRTAVSNVISSIGEEAAITFSKAGETFVITANTDWYAVWAIDANGNDIPDYKEADFVFNKGNAMPATIVGFPKTQKVEIGTTYTFTNLGFKTPGYTIIGWSVGQVPLITSQMFEDMFIPLFGAYYELGGSIIVPSGTTTLYAVWAVDTNNDGVPDYRPAKEPDDATGTRSGILSHGANAGSDLVDNDNITGKRVWTFENTLYLNTDEASRVNIYNLNGILIRQLNIPVGSTNVQLARGIYIVDMDGARYKCVIN